MKKKTKKPLPAVIALTVITSVHLGTAWAADGGTEDAGADAATNEPAEEADAGDTADGGVDDDEYTSCGAKKSSRDARTGMRSGLVMFGTGCC